MISVAYIHVAWFVYKHMQMSTTMGSNKRTNQTSGRMGVICKLITEPIRSTDGQSITRFLFGESMTTPVVNCPTMCGSAPQIKFAVFTSMAE